MDFLNADSSPSISPKRFGLVFRVDMQTLAAQAHVHRNTLRLAPDTETLQAHLRESLRVMRAAADVSGSIEKAIFWFKNHPLPVFDYKTAQDLVSEKRTEALIKYLQSLRAGYSG
ncbi:MAG: MbcA/ParS/Xre antitoxin family protein [Burkholderiaceae bacterium]|nr:MbcA/ParS/Xre antitoxin family protein [Burkholderiaceae bacterium]